MRDKRRTPAPAFDMRQCQTGVAQIQSVIITEAAWEILRSRCREMNDAEFAIKTVHKRRIDFTLTDALGEPQDYTIHATDLKGTSRVASTKLFSLFLTFEVNGQGVVDTDKQWFEPIRLWLMFWSGKGQHPRMLRTAGEKRSSLVVHTDSAVQRWQKAMQRRSSN